MASEKSSKRSQKHLDNFTPEMQTAMITLMQLMGKEYPQYDFTITEGLRTLAEQAELFKKGSSTTNAPAGKSYHNFGVGADMYPLTTEGILPYEPNKAVYQRMGEVAGNVGLEWGGNWTSPFDPGHFQYGEKPWLKKKKK